jgi:hypothetical protein
MVEGKGLKQPVQWPPDTWKFWNGNQHHQQCSYMIITDTAVMSLGLELSIIVMGYENYTTLNERKHCDYKL